MSSPTKISDPWTLFKTYLRPHWKWVVLLVLAYFLVSLLTAFQPVIMAPMLNVVLDFASETVPPATESVTSVSQLDLNNLGQYLIRWLDQYKLTPWNIVWVLALSYLLVSVLLYALDFGVYLLAIWIRVNSERDIQQNLFSHLLSLSLDFYHRKRTGEIISRIDQDTRSTVASLANIARNLVVSSILVLVYGAMLVRTNFRLTIFIVVAGSLHYGITQLIRNPIRARVRDQFNIFADTTAFIQEIVANIRVVKSFVAERYEQSRLSKLLQRMLGINLRYSLFKHVEEPIGQIINALMNVAILMLATAELFNGGLSTTGFFLYLYIGRSILTPITNLTRTYTMIQTTLATSERVLDLFGEEPLVEGADHSVSELQEEISFKQVSFRYQTDAVLEDIDLQIKRGEITALVGPSGAGKSTITDLLLRFYDPEKGQVLLDGLDVRQMDLDAYRRLFGVVSQESQLFNDTVANNIAYPDIGVDLQAIENAAQVANALDFIQELPNGFQSLIGDRGVLLSGGQRQRLAIARAVVRSPQILILDEATSSLDSESEKLVQGAIDRVIKNATAVIIAHRLSTIISADKIIVIDDGRIVDQGKHDELLSRCQLYRKLCELQFGAEAVARETAK